MVVLVVLVEHGRDLFPVPPDREQGLLVVVGGDVEEEEIDAGQGSGEDARVDVHPAACVARDPVKAEVLLSSPVIRLAPVNEI